MIFIQINIISNIPVLFYNLEVHFGYLSFGLISVFFLIVYFLIIKKSKNKLDIKNTNKEKSFGSETKTKNTFLYPEQNLGKLEQGKVCESETFSSYENKYKVSEFTIIDKDKK